MTRNSRTQDEILDPEDEVEAAPVPDSKDLQQIAVLAQRYLTIEKDISDLITKLKEKELELKVLRETDLPLAMTTLGMTKFTLVGGGEVCLKTDTLAGITEKNKEKAFAWLEEHGHGGLIKHSITVFFGKGEDKWAKKFMSDLAKRKKPLNFERKDSVHTGTLRAFVKEQIKASKAKGMSPDKEIPFDLLGVYEPRFVEVTLPEEKK